MFFFRPDVGQTFFLSFLCGLQSNNSTFILHEVSHKRLGSVAGQLSGSDDCSGSGMFIRCKALLCSLKKKDSCSSLLHLEPEP